MSCVGTVIGREKLPSCRGKGAVEAKGNMVDLRGTFLEPWVGLADLLASKIESKWGEILPIFSAFNPGDLLDA